MMVGLRRGAKVENTLKRPPHRRLTGLTAYVRWAQGRQWYGTVHPGRCTTSLSAWILARRWQNNNCSTTHKAGRSLCPSD